MLNINKKIAIFHNYMDNIGGAEVVALSLAREFKADIYTTNISPAQIKKMGFEDVLPHIYSIGRIPINAPLKQQFALWRFRFLNLGKKYDFYIIDGDWAMSGAVKNKPNLWDIHSPIREIWDLYEYVRQNNVPWILRPIFDVWVYYNRYLNKKYVKEVGTLISNSKNIQARVKKYLNKDSVVVHPPVITSDFHFEKTGDYWLSVNRLLNQKRIDLQLNAFAKLPNEKLIIVGSYEQSRHFKEYANHCQDTKPDNVEIRSWISRPELIKLYANCKGFITTSKDEDFGMNVVEAMASGKPVIAPNEGGYKETIIDGETGILINDIDVQKLITAIDRLNKELVTAPTKYKNACIEQAKRFDIKIFTEKIRSLMTLPN